MGRIATILQFIRRARGSAFWPALKVEDRKGDNNIVEMFQSAGDDSPPLPGDNVALIDSQRQGGRVAVGVIDHKNEGIAVAGEKRIYARDSAGAIVSELHLKGDGSFSINDKTGNYAFSIDASGNALLNCKTWSVVASGNITETSTGHEITSATLTNNSTNIGDSHFHDQPADSNGDTEANTGGPQ